MESNNSHSIAAPHIMSDIELLHSIVAPSVAHATSPSSKENNTAANTQSVFIPFEEGDSFRRKHGEPLYSDMIHFLEHLGFEISIYFKRCQGIEEVVYEIEHF